MLFFENTLAYFTNHHYELIRITPLVVVPREHVDKISVNDFRHGKIRDRSVRITNQIGGHQRLFRHVKNTFPTSRTRRLAKRLIDMLNVRSLTQKNREARKRDVKRRNTDSHSVKLSLKIRRRFRGRLRRTRMRRDDVTQDGTRATPGGVARG